MVRMLLFCLFWFVLVSDSYQTPGQTSENLRKGAILNQMREWGKRTFESKLYKTGDVQNQFLVAAVITPTILSNVTELQLIDGCPLQPDAVNTQTFNDTSLICSRSAVIFNRADEKVWERSRWHDQEAYKNHSWHGEYLFLYEDILQQLQKNAKPNVPCEIILYSHFIPCNPQKHFKAKQPYRCADLLSQYDGSEDKCKITTIGYNTAHPYTANNGGLEEALTKLRGKGYNVIKLAKKSEDPDAVLIGAAITEIALSSPFMFQDIFYSCLRHTPIKKCCIDPRDQSNPDRIFSYYTNYITRNAVKNKNVKNDGGRLLRTKAQKERIETNFRLEVDESLGEDCPMCPGEISKQRMSLYVNTCAKKAFDMTDFFGRTEELITHEWVKYDAKWRNLYAGVQDTSSKDSHMSCLNGTSVQSLCTKKDTRTESPPRKRTRVDQSFGGPSGSDRSSPLDSPFDKLTIGN